MSYNVAMKNIAALILLSACAIQPESPVKFMTGRWEGTAEYQGQRHALFVNLETGRAYLGGKEMDGGVYGYHVGTTPVLCLVERGLGVCGAIMINGISDGGEWGGIMEYGASEVCPRMAVSLQRRVD